MKLAEALQERADIQKRLSQLRGRLLNNAKVQEGEKPVENPAELLQEMDGMILRLEELILRINMTNSATMDNGERRKSALCAISSTEPANWWNALHIRKSRFTAQCPCRRSERNLTHCPKTFEASTLGFSS